MKFFSLKLILVLILFGAGSFLASAQQAMMEISGDNFEEDLTLCLAFNKSGFVPIYDTPDMELIPKASVPTNSFVKVKRDGQHFPGWVQVEFSMVDYDELLLTGELGYIPENSLVELSSRQVGQIVRCIKPGFKNRLLSEFFIVDRKYPHVMGYQDYERGYVSIWNMLTHEEIFSYEKGACFSHRNLEGETSYLILLGHDFDNPKGGYIRWVDIRLREKRDGSPEFYCAEFYPEIPSMTAKAIEEVIRQGGKEDCYPLLLAACNGSKKAREMLLNLDYFDRSADARKQLTMALEFFYYFEDFINHQKK